jgi:hypothetical protein
MPMLGPHSASADAGHGSFILRGRVVLHNVSVKTATRLRFARARTASRPEPRSSAPMMEFPTPFRRSRLISFHSNHSLPPNQCPPLRLHLLAMFSTCHVRPSFQHATRCLQGFPRSHWTGANGARPCMPAA